MNRVATPVFHQALSGSIQRAQAQLVTTQQEVASGKKASTYAGLGGDTVRSTSARSMLSRTEAYATVAARTATTLSLYDANLTQAESTASTLRQDLFTALGRGNTLGLQSTIESAFDAFANTLNATEGGVPLFAGSRTSETPFKVGSLADTLSLAGNAAFASDDGQQTARLGDGLDVRFGVGAHTIGGDALEAFRTLAAAGPFGEMPTDAQKAALKQAIEQLDKGIGAIQTANAENGRKQAHVETLANNAEARGVILKTIISDSEDVDLAQVAINLAQQKTALDASYSVFAKLSGLSLVNFFS